MPAENEAGVVVMMTALNLEYAAVRAHLTDTRKHHHDAGTVFEAGRLPGVAGSIVLAVTGDGPQRAAVLTDRAISMFRPRAVLFVGIAGALHRDLRLGDVIVATKVYGYHGGVDGAVFQARPRAFEAPHRLEQLARHLAADGRWTGFLPPMARADPPRVRLRPIASGEVVLNSRTSALAEHLRSMFGDAAAIEMEGAGAAYAGHLNESVPVMVVRGISDLADGQKLAADRAGHQEVAAAHAAAFALALASDIVAQNSQSANLQSANSHSPDAQIPKPSTSEPSTSESVTSVSVTSSPATSNGVAPDGAASYSGLTKLALCRRLHDTWTELADVLEIRPYEQERFAPGDEARGVWQWLEVRDRLGELRPALVRLGRDDLVRILDTGA